MKTKTGVISGPTNGPWSNKNYCTWEVVLLQKILLNFLHFVLKLQVFISSQMKVTANF